MGNLPIKNNIYVKKFYNSINKIFIPTGFMHFILKTIHPLKKYREKESNAKITTKNVSVEQNGLK